MKKVGMAWIETLWRIRIEIANSVAYIYIYI
jgi:hypothetical protein